MDQGLKRRWLIFAVGLLIAALAVADHRLRQSGCAADSVLIGVAQPLSGDLAGLGEDLLNGARLASEQINALGGVNVCGRRLPIRLLVEDDRASPEAGVESARRLVAGGALAVIGHLNSGVSIAAAPIYADATVPQLAISTKPEFTKLGLSTTLRLVASDSMQAAAMASIAAELQGAKLFAIVDDGTPYGIGLAEGVEGVLERKGHSIALRQSLNDKARDFGTLVGEMRQKKIDVLVTTLGDFQVEILAREAAAAGLKDLRILGGDTIKTSRLQKLQLEWPLIYATSPVVDVKHFSGGKAFLKTFQEKYGKEPVYAAHYAFDAVHLVADALTRTETLNREDLLQRLKSFDGSCPVTNSIRFAPDGEQRYGVVAFHQLRRGSWELIARSDRW